MSNGHQKMNVLRRALKLVMIFLVLSLPLPPSLAQNQPETQFPSFELLSGYERHSNLPNDLHFPSLSVPLNLVSHAGSLFSL